VCCVRYSDRVTPHAPQPTDISQLVHRTGTQKLAGVWCSQVIDVGGFSSEST
jgi:hypothetical protein